MSLWPCSTFSTERLSNACFTITIVNFLTVGQPRPDCEENSTLRLEEKDERQINVN